MAFTSKRPKKAPRKTGDLVGSEGVLTSFYTQEV